MATIKIECPFCGRVHEPQGKRHRFGTCECGAEYRVFFYDGFESPLVDWKKEARHG